MKKYLALFYGLVLVSLVSNVLFEFQLSNPSPSAPRAGTVVTTINSTDRITDAPTTLNANFLALNNGKIENSTTSLPKLTTLAGLTSAATLATVGTITSGIWNATAIGVGFGGTGTTSPTSNLVILGNGASGFKTVNGLGTSGQTLTSGGAGVAPTWVSGSVDQTQNYTWTGYHIFNTGGFVVAASSTFTALVTLNSTAAMNVDPNAILTGIARMASTSVWTTSGTWVKPLGAKVVDVYVFGGGGGGGSGRRGATNGSGGAGGGGGGVSFKEINASALGSSETVTVGGGGPGGTSISGSDNDGNIGTNGGASSFGTTIIIQTSGGSGGGGGVVTGSTGGSGGTGNGDWITTGGAGGNGKGTSGGSITAGVTTASVTSPRGGGGAYDSEAVSPNNGAAGGGFTTNYVFAGGAGGIGAGGDGTATNAALLYGGVGGAGGGETTQRQTNGFAGGKGGFPGGGGGGGSGDTGGTSGVGGAGAAGMVVITTYF